MKTEYFEITGSLGNRPNHPEDNTRIIQAVSAESALSKWNEIVGSGLDHSIGNVKQVRQIYFVWDDKSIEYEKVPFLKR